MAELVQGKAASWAGVAAGVGLVGAGLLMRRTDPRVRALLVAAGLLDLAVVASTAPHEHSDTATYPPLDVPKALAENVWVVDSGPLHGILPMRMTVIRLPDGSLLLHSPTRMTEELRGLLDRLGPVRTLVAPNQMHWMFVPEWQRAYPDAVTWAAPGLGKRRQVKKAKMWIDHDLSETPPAEWGGVLELIEVPGGMGFKEIAFHHRPSATLVLTDLVLNLETARLPRLLRPFARLMGMTAPNGSAPAYLRAVMRGGGRAAQDAAARLVALRPTRVVFSHGRMFNGDVAGALARSLGWLLPKT